MLPPTIHEGTHHTILCTLFPLNLEHSMTSPDITQGTHASRFFSDLAPGWWNDLPLTVQRAEPAAVFKRTLKTYFFTEPSNEH